MLPDSKILQKFTNTELNIPSRMAEVPLSSLLALTFIFKVKLFEF